MKVLFTKSFAKDLRRHKKNPELMGQIRKIIEKVEQAEAVTELTQLKQLKADGRFFRIRIGDYRIGITVEDDEITFIRVLHRKEIYRFFP